MTTKKVPMTSVSQQRLDETLARVERTCGEADAVLNGHRPVPKAIVVTNDAACRDAIRRVLESEPVEAVFVDSNADLSALLDGQSVVFLLDYTKPQIEAVKRCGVRKIVAQAGSIERNNLVEEFRGLRAVVVEFPLTPDMIRLAL